MTWLMTERDTSIPLVLIYTVWPDEATCLRVAEELVAGGWVACVNCLGPVRAIFTWEGKVEHAIEFAALFKVAPGRAQYVSSLIAERHPYQIPAVIALPAQAEGTLRTYAEWINGPGETG